jgi:hypothetical protein
MIKVLLTRAFKSPIATLGMIKIEGIDHDPIFTLENPWRNNIRDSNIVEGTYLCKPYSGTFFKNVYILENVPGRSAILFHWGNLERDTDGCILIGLQAGSMQDEPAIMQSRRAMEYFRKLIGQNEFELTVL